MATPALAAMPFAAFGAQSSDLVRRREGACGPSALGCPWARNSIDLPHVGSEQGSATRTLWAATPRIRRRLGVVDSLSGPILDESVHSLIRVAERSKHRVPLRRSIGKHLGVLSPCFWGDGDRLLGADLGAVESRASETGMRVGPGRHPVRTSVSSTDRGAGSRPGSASGHSRHRQGLFGTIWWLRRSSIRAWKWPRRSPVTEVELAFISGSGISGQYKCRPPGSCRHGNPAAPAGRSVVEHRGCSPGPGQGAGSAQAWHSNRPGHRPGSAQDGLGPHVARARMALWPTSEPGLRSGAMPTPTWARLRAGRDRRCR